MNILSPKIFEQYTEVKSGLTLVDSALPGHGTILGNRGGSPIDAAYNRAILATEFGVDPYHVAAPSINFTNVVVGVDGALRRVEADAVVTDEPGWICLTTMADCFPILAYDPVKKAVGSMHNGWANTKQNFAQTFIQHFVDNYQTNPSDVVLWIGPGLARQSFEVTEEFLPNFDAKYFEKSDDTHWLFDHRQAVNDQFLQAGVTKIDNLDDDTKANDQYFSARRQGPNAGRMAAAILLQHRQ